MAWPYVTTADLRDGALGPFIDVPSTTGTGLGAVSDARLDAMIVAASNIIDRYTMDHFDSPGSVNEVQTVTLTDFSGTDSFTLTFGAATTASIVRGTNCTAAGVKAALEDISTIYPNHVSVTGTTDAGPFTVTFDDGTLAASNVAEMTGTGTGCTVTVATTTAGAAGSLAIRMFGTGDRMLYLPRRVRAVTAVSVTDESGNATALDSDDYGVMSSFDDVTGSNIVSHPLGHDALYLKVPISSNVSGTAWPVEPWTVTVTGTWGWQVTPEEVKQACARLVWKMATNALPMGASSVTMGGTRYERVQATLDSTGDPEVDQILQHRRRVQYAGVVS